MLFKDKKLSTTLIKSYYIYLQQIISMSEILEQPAIISSNDASQQKKLSPNFNSLQEYEYISSFIKDDFEEQKYDQKSEIAPKDQNLMIQEKKTISERRCKRKKGRLCNKKQKNSCEPSKYHNFQKHLNNALKFMIHQEKYQDSALVNERMATLIWRAFKKSKIKSRKILYFLFNEEAFKNIKQHELREFRLLDIYLKYGGDIFLAGKSYLIKWAIEEITEQAIISYLNSRRIQNMEGFKAYILEFRTELINGGMTKRIRN